MQPMRLTSGRSGMRDSRQEQPAAAGAAVSMLARQVSALGRTSAGCMQRVAGLCPPRRANWTG